MQLQYDTYMYTGKNYLPGLSQHDALQNHDNCNAMITGYSHQTEHPQYIVTICIRNVRDKEHYQKDTGSLIGYYFIVLHLSLKIMCAMKSS
jgi:hypothetical protein